MFVFANTIFPLVNACKQGVQGWGRAAIIGILEKKIGHFFIGVTAYTQICRPVVKFCQLTSAYLMMLKFCQLDKISKDTANRCNYCTYLAIRRGFCPSRMTSNNEISPMKFWYNTNFTLPKQSQRSRSVFQDRSRLLGLFWKENNLSYNRRNTVYSCHKGV